MIYQLPNGKCIEISLEFFLSMTDEDEQSLIAMDTGFMANNPFSNSVLKDGEMRISLSEEACNDDDDEEEDEDMDKYQPMQDITDEEKINDHDFINEE